MRKIFDEVFEDVTKYGTKVKTDEYHANGAHIIIDQGQEQIAGYTDLEDGLFTSVPALVFGDHTRVVKYIDEPFFLGADGVKVLRCKYADANYRYLYYALKSIRIPNTGYNRHFKWLKDSKIEYPNNGEQSSIVTILDKVLGIIDARTAELQKFDSLIKARFVEMFGTIHNNPNNYEIKSLQDVCEPIKDGTHQTPTYTEDRINGYKFLSSKDVTTGRINWDNIKYIPPDLHEQLYARIQPKKNDILLAKNGTTGIAAIVDRDEIFDIYVSLALLKPLNINSVYMWAAINSQETKEQFNSSLKGIGVPNLHLCEIKKAKIIVPPIELQNKFADFVKQVDKSKFAVQKALDEAQLLFESLMQKYFG